MKAINTIDLWTEQLTNHYECFNGAFVDGVSKAKSPFDSYKVVKNCNCIITCDNKNINITNKHHAIVFYKKQQPVRLVVLNKDTDIDKCINVALSQLFDNQPLLDVYKKLNIKSAMVDLKQKPVFNLADRSKEIDVGSCDRWALLYNMLKGSYTESQTNYGNFGSCNYEFMPNISLEYNLTTDSETFAIKHNCAFINDIGTRLIPIQQQSKLTQ